MPPGKPRLPPKVRASAVLCVVGAIVGTGLYFGNLFYLGAKTKAAWAAAVPRTIPDPYGPMAPDAMAFSRDSKTLAAGSHDGRIRLWDVATGEPQATLHDGNTQIVDAVAFSPDGKTLAAANLDHTVRLWDVTDDRSPKPTTLGSHLNGAISVAFSPDGKTLVSTGNDDMIRLWDPASGTLWAAREGPTTNSGISATFSPDSKTLAAGGLGAIELWRVPAG